MHFLRMLMMLILIIVQMRKSIFITFEAGCPRQMNSERTIRHAVFIKQVLSVRFYSANIH